LLIIKKERRKEGRKEGGRKGERKERKGLNFLFFDFPIGQDEQLYTMSESMSVRLKIIVYNER
jgi:hypothetical protein